MIRAMRTTLTIDDDVLAAATALARRQGTSIGSALSALARSALRRLATRQRNGIMLLARGGGEAVVTLETVHALGDEAALHVLRGA
jgi:hypothetical protein